MAAAELQNLTERGLMRTQLARIHHSSSSW
jgi:hypothetical protein